MTQTGTGLSFIQCLLYHSGDMSSFAIADRLLLSLRDLYRAPDNTDRRWVHSLTQRTGLRVANGLIWE